MARTIITLLAVFSVALACTDMVTITGLNLRSGPGTAYSVSRTVAANTAVCVESTSNGWSKLNNGLYCSYKYLKAAESSTPVTPSTTCKTMYTTASSLRVRAGPSTTYATVRSVPKHTEVCVITESGSWSQIGEKEFVSSAYLTTTKPNTTTPSTPSSSGDKRKCVSFWNKYSTSRYPTRSEFVSAFKDLVGGTTITYTQSTSRWSGISNAVCPPSLPPYADCSSFVSWAYWTAFGGLTDVLNNAKWAYGNTSSMFAQGTVVSSSTSGCLEGDLIGYSGHCAIYAGSNKVVNYGSTGPLKYLNYNIKTIKGCYRHNFPFGSSF